MGIADRYADGEWNFQCDLCGRKAKSSTAMKTWDNHYVCQHHKEVRNPQDFVAGVKDDQTVPWTRSTPADTFVNPGHFPVILDTLGRYIFATDGTPLFDVGL